MTSIATQEHGPQDNNSVVTKETVVSDSVPSSSSLSHQSTTGSSSKLWRITKGILIGPPSRWTLLFITTLAALLASFQSSALIMALPSLIKELDMTIDGCLWILDAFMLIIAIAVPFTARIGDMIGKAPVFIFGLIAFSFGSILCGAAPASRATGWDLVVYRIIQGLGAAFIFANGTSLIADSFIPYGQLGIAIAINQMAFAAGAVFGPVYGAVLSLATWRLIFLLNLPFAAVAILVCLVKLRKANMDYIRNIALEHLKAVAAAKAKQAAESVPQQVELEEKKEQEPVKPVSSPALSDDMQLEEGARTTSTDSLADHEPTAEVQIEHEIHEVKLEEELKEQTATTESVQQETVQQQKEKTKLRIVYEKLKYVGLKLDFIGTILIVISITALLISLSDVSFPSVGLIARRTLFGVFGGFLIVFIIFEFFWFNPVIDPRLFFNRSFTVGNVSNALLSFAQGTVLFSLIFYLQGPFGKTPLLASVMIMPYGGAMLICGFASGFISDRIGTSLLCTVGSFICGGGILGMCFLKTHTNYGLLVLYMLLVGAGVGLFNSPNATLIMASVPHDRRGTAAGTRILLSMVFRAISTSVTFVLLFGKLSLDAILQIFLVGGGISDQKESDAFMRGLRINMWVAFSLSMAACVVCLFAPWDWLHMIIAAIKKRRKTVATTTEST
jgi:MFS family permease